ncbi:sulfurtransferase [Corynebacterium ulceribovis]|uniref:sulfurtransferase n=1 Tax=Corynebacterium ulceribovis TaxID=487732 RepID=UPI000360501C|nr:rhodanese-like domain-containing protein [Corynebacterium ulceribovis]
MALSVSAQELSAQIHDGNTPVILDTRWTKGILSYSQFTMAHIPQSLYCNVEEAMCSWPSREAGRNPIPTASRLQRFLRQAGITSDSSVVVYDTENCKMAGRTWWVLRWAGVRDVKILTGGIKEWEAEALQIVGGPGRLANRSKYQVQLDSIPSLNTEQVLQWMNAGKVIVDTREPNRFRGLTEKLDFQAGHIKGAVNIPVDQLYNRRDGWASEDKVRTLFAEVGVTDASQAVLYSGSGLHSSLAIAAMHNVGMPGAANYIGGWSQWSVDASRPFERH